MAKRMTAVQAYTPRIKQSKTSSLDDLVEFVAGRAPLNQGTVELVLSELREAIIHFATFSIPVKIDKLGTFKGGIDRNGKRRILFKADPILTKRLNKVESIPGLRNEDMIGKSVDDLIARWNEDHPDDPVED